MKFGTLQLQSRDQKLQFLKIKMAAAAILKIVFFCHYSLSNWPISAKFCMRKQNGMLTTATGQKMQMCKIEGGGRPPFWKSLNRHISVKNCQILMTLVHYIRYWTQLQSRDQKMKFLQFKMVATAILKFVFLVITHRPIVRFRRNFVCGSRTSWRQRRHDKNCKFIKSNMADGRHFENR